MRWLLVSVALVAFSLTAPAQAETSSCSYYDKVKKGPMPFSFVHNGGTFDVPVFKTGFRVIHETSKVIQFVNAKDVNKKTFRSKPDALSDRTAEDTWKDVVAKL